MRISDWSSDVCSSDLEIVAIGGVLAPDGNGGRQPEVESMRVGQVEAKARARAVEGPAGTARAADRRHPPVVSEQFELHHFTPRAPAERRRLVAKARGIDLVLDRDVVATIAEGIGNRIRAHAVGAAESKLLHRHETVVAVDRK